MNIAKTLKSDRYNQIDVGDLTYLNNYYDYGYDSTGWVEWRVYAGDQISSGAYQFSTNNTAAISYFVPDTLGDGFYRVRAYPCILAGSMGGRDSSHGVGDKTGNHKVKVLADSGRCWSKVYDMRDVNRLVHLPEKLNNLLNKTITISFKHKSEDLAYDNVFLDSYLHYIGDKNIYPVGYLDSWGELNKINAGETSAFNINIWTQMDQHPHSSATTAWTGGTIMIDEFTLPSGQRCSINVKHERKNNKFDEGCSGGFFYVGIILEGKDTEEKVVLNYGEILDYVCSEEFKKAVLSHREAKAIYKSVGSPPFPIDEKENYILDGIALGKEVWFNKNEYVSSATFKEVEFNIAGKIISSTTSNNNINPKLDSTPTPTPTPISESDETINVVLDKITKVGEEVKILNKSVNAKINQVTNKTNPEILSDESKEDYGYKFTAAKEGFSEIKFDTEDSNITVTVNLLVNKNPINSLLPKTDTTYVILALRGLLYIANISSSTQSYKINEHLYTIPPLTMSKLNNFEGEVQDIKVTTVSI
jgi:hypothetical protein